VVSIDGARTAVRPPELPVAVQRHDSGGNRPRDGIDNGGRVQGTDVENPLAPAVAISPQQREQLEVDLNFQFDPGRHTADSPVLGSRIAEMDAVVAAAQRNPDLVAFSNALYDGNIYLLPPELMNEASKAAMQDFGSYVQQRYSGTGLTPNNAVTWTKGDITRTYIYTTENEHNTWRIHAMVGRFPPTNDTGFLPRAIAARHELMHVELTRYGEQPHTDHGNQLPELLPTVMTIIEADALRKRLTGQPIDATIDYGRNVEWGGNSVPLGTLANRMRELVERYGSYGAAMSQEGVLEYLGR
jgi:hypothetical protein